nr:hypothetical protein HK105_006661 [Polyrhizophydium stewartii]
MQAENDIRFARQFSGQSEKCALLSFEFVEKGTTRRRTLNLSMYTADFKSALGYIKRTIFPKAASLFAYPFDGQLTVTVRDCDRERLNEGMYLNDVIIEFYLKLKKPESGLDPAQVHIFSSYLFEKLSRTSDGRTVKPEQFQDAYDSVKSWTSKVDIFSKRFLLIPINEYMHWYLAIVHNPGALILAPKEEMRSATDGIQPVSPSDLPATSPLAHAFDEIPPLEAPRSGRLDRTKPVPWEGPRAFSSIVANAAQGFGLNDADDDAQPELSPTSKISMTPARGDALRDPADAEPEKGHLDDKLSNPADTSIQPGSSPEPSSASKLFRQLSPSPASRTPQMKTDQAGMDDLSLLSVERQSGHRATPAARPPVRLAVLDNEPSTDDAVTVIDDEQHTATEVISADVDVSDLIGGPSQQIETTTPLSQAGQTAMDSGASRPPDFAGRYDTRRLASLAHSESHKVNEKFEADTRAAIKESLRDLASSDQASPTEASLRRPRSDSNIGSHAAKRAKQGTEERMEDELKRSVLDAA